MILPPSMPNTEKPAARSVTGITRRVVGLVVRTLLLARWHIRVAGVAIVLFSGMSLSGSPPGSELSKPTPPDAWAEFMDSMQKMHVAMVSIAPSGDADVDFVRLMMPHHEAAIDMAKAQLLHGTDPQMRRLAQEIVTDQQSEIELMQLWLRQHKRVTSEAK